MNKLLLLFASLLLPLMAHADITDTYFGMKLGATVTRKQIANLDKSKTMSQGYICFASEDGTMNLMFINEGQDQVFDSIEFHRGKPSEKKCSPVDKNSKVVMDQLKEIISGPYHTISFDTIYKSGFSSMPTDYSDERLYTKRIKTETKCWRGYTEEEGAFAYYGWSTTDLRLVVLLKSGSPDSVEISTVLDGAELPTPPNIDCTPPAEKK